MFVKVNQNSDTTVFVEVSESISVENLEDRIDDIINERIDERGKSRGNVLLNNIDTSNASFTLIESSPSLPEEKHNKGPYSDFASVDKFIVYKDGTIETHEHFL